MINPPKKALIVAYAYEPNKTSEPGVGWHFVHEISKFMEVTVITRANNRVAIEKEKDTANIKYIYFDLSTTMLQLKKKIPLSIQIYYMFWQRKVYAQIKDILRNETFDVVHHLTFGTTKNVPAGYTIDLPFIWGPIGGGDLIPYRFLRKMDLRAHFNELLYYIMHAKSTISPMSYMTRKKASAIIFRTNSSAINFPQNGCKSRYLIPESAMPEGPMPETVVKDISKGLNVLCVGRLMNGKGYNYALEGFHFYLKAGGIGHLVFLGRGPEEVTLKRYVQRNNLKDSVTFKGFVSNAEVQRDLQQGHVLLHPSFREGGSWAIMEAMSFGLPVICLNTSGPKDMVTENCGLRIDLGSPEQVARDIGEGLLKLVGSAYLYGSLSRNASQRIKEEYNWDRRRVQMEQVYTDVLERNSNSE